MRIAISSEKCSGHGRCYTLAPSVYETDEMGFNAQRGQVIDVPADEEEAARLGVISCPEEALTIVEE
jgi:ferredoxin